MSDETPGAGQSALPPREDTTSRPTVRVAQVQGGQFILSSQPHTIPPLTQITNGNVATNATLTPGGVTRIISLSPVRNQTSPLRPSLTNQTIVSALTKSRTNSNIRLQLFPGGDISPQGVTTTKSPVKRSLPLNSEKDSYTSKLQRVINHRNVRSKIVKEKFNEHLLECYYLEIGGNILDLYQFAKRPKTQQFLAYVKENAIDPKDNSEEVANLQPVLPVTTPSATCVTSLPGISHSMLPTTVQNAQISTTQCVSTYAVTTPKSSNGNKMKMSVGYPTGINQEQIVEKAKQEAYVVQRISDLQKEGLWSEKRLPKIQEMPRAKAHWDFLLEEMVWLAADFAQERKWKKAAAKKCARMVQKYFQDKALAAQRAERAQEQHIRRIAAFCAKEIKTFWSNVEKLVEYKQNTRLEEKRKKALDQHLSFIVDQTEKYSQLLAEGMNKQGCVEGVLKPSLTIEEQTVPNSYVSSRLNSTGTLSDDDFHPSSISTSSDDEDTIALEEEITKEEETAEVAALQRESEMDLDSFLKELPKDYLVNRNSLIKQENEMSESEVENDDNDVPSKSDGEKETKDEDFVVDSSDEDDEETIQEQEQVEGTQDHQQEIEELKAENELSVEELRKKYTNLPSIPNDEIDVLSENSKSSDEEIEYSSTESFESESENTYSLIHQKNDNFDLEFVLDNAIEFQNEGEEKKTDNNDLINDAAAIAESIQPKGNTLSSTSVVTPVPFLLKLPLREYQHIGLDWLVTMFERKLNGILADEMGLGKTIQTIALLTHLACEKENWGPHLIIVPTSVMLNWEMECKKWCPAFKILTYYGTQKERKLKRTGWTKPNAFHICITSYKLVIQDHQSFRRKKWKYLILDEAQNIKNFKSQRWQLLLNFQTQQRLLLTGTPLQNNLMELWSLMHFLMPHVFQSHREFKEWFSNPVAGMIEGNSEYNDSIIKRLHKVLRPFLLRRLKSEVEKQMPKKYEHIIMCRLSKRQRYLYDDYMSRAKTRETLASGNLLSVINVLMQLRKVCNHPNLFEVRPTISPFHCEGITQHIPSLIYDVFEYNPFNQINLLSLNLCLLEMELYLSAYQCYRMRQYETPKKLIEEMYSEKMIPPDCPPARLSMCVRKVQNIKEAKVEVKEEINSKPNQLLHTAATVKLKVGPGVQLIQQGVPVPHVSIGNQTSGPNINLSSVLKPSEKITVPAGFAQLVQTSTGKHILFTPSSCISTSNLAMGSATVMTSTGQRLTVLSQSVVANTSNPPQTLAKAVVKVQLTSVPSATTSTISTTSPDIKLDDRIPLQTKTVSSKYIEKLYANQSSKRDLDVRWMNKNEEKKYSNEENMETMDSKRNKAALIYRVNSKRCSAVPLYGQDFRNAVKVTTPTKTHWINGRLYSLNVHCSRNVDISECLRNLVFRPDDIMEKLKDTFNRFIVYVPAVHAPEIELQVWHPSPSVYWGRKLTRQRLTNDFSKPTTLLHPIVSAMITQFPHPRLIQYDCGKLQTLDKLLRKLKSEGHRVLIFTQMTKMLDVLEAFLNFHGHIYLRLDGTTKVDQRQILMERFNGDTRIFAFILSTRSGGIGVNLTGADTVIFYDSDWNPTMDAQAQDRCHRIGQTRDVHIYRLVSERTIEENILKKANQKRLLGDLAIEGGNFTTAYFKSSTIQDLFNIDANEEKTVLKTSETQNPNVENQRLSGVVSVPTPAPDDKVAIGALENALAACEDDQDVQAARIAKAEAVADLAEFDETIPLEEQDKEKEPEISKAEQEVENLIKQLTPIERYAMRFIEETEAMWSAEQLAAAEREIEEQKLQWERNRLAAMQEEKERRAKEMEEENELLTFSREDATNQVWVSNNSTEQMPMWCPPTPPQQDTDVYVDQTMAFLYDTSIMTEIQLPPAYVKKEAKRSRHEAGLIDSRRSLKIHRKDESVYAPRSLFERPSPALIKMRRDIKLQKYRGIVRPPVPIPGMKLTISKPSIDPPCFHNWTIHEDMALLKVIQSFQGLPLNLMILTPGHTPNWDFVADYVNTVSLTYRSPKQCRNRYETVLIPREEGKQVFDSSPRKKKVKTSLYRCSTQNKSNRPMRTSQQYIQDNNASFSQVLIQRYEALKNIANKRTYNTKTVVNNPLLKNPKHVAVLNECGIDLDHPILPVEVAARRAERIAREKKTPEQQLAAQRLLIKGALPASQGQSGVPQSNLTTSVSGNSTAQVVSSSIAQVTIVQTSVVTTTTTTTTTVITTPSTPPNALRTQRIVASPLQTQTVVSMSALSPAQLQAATQRLIVSGTPTQTKTVVGSTATVSGKTISPAQLQMIRQATLKQQQLRLQAGGIAAQAVKTSTVTIAGQPAVQVQFTQAQPRTQYLKPGTVTVTGKQGITRTVTESEMNQLLKRQQQLQQQKALATAGSNQTPIQNISPQSFAQAIQQASTSGTQVATLVKTVSSSGVTQTVTIPVTGVTIGQVKALAPGNIKATNPQQLRQLHIQQQLLAQKKLNQKIAGIAQVTGKAGVATQLIVGSKPFSSPITMQQFQQVIRSPLTVQQGPVVLTKGTPRVIPVNAAAQGTKPTIQVVAATSQGITTSIRPQNASTLSGALAGIKVQGNTTPVQQAALLSQVSAALQGQSVGVRQSSPVRIQTGNSTPIVAVSVQSSSNIQQESSPQPNNVDKADQASI